MEISSDHHHRGILLLISVIVVGMTLACARTALPDDSPTWQVPGQGGEPQPLAIGMPTKTPFLPPIRLPGAPILTPTPDAPHPLPALRTEPEQYAVQPGDTLGIIASVFGVSLEELIGANELINPNILEVGQILTVPVPTPKGVGPMQPGDVVRIEIEKIGVLENKVKQA